MCFWNFGFKLVSRLSLLLPSDGFFATRLGVPWCLCKSRIWRFLLEASNRFLLLLVRHLFLVAMPSSSAMCSTVCRSRHVSSLTPRGVQGGTGCCGGSIISVSFRPCHSLLHDVSCESVASVARIFAEIQALHYHIVASFSAQLHCVALR